MSNSSRHGMYVSIYVKQYELYLWIAIFAMNKLAKEATSSETIR